MKKYQNWLLLAGSALFLFFWACKKDIHSPYDGPSSILPAAVTPDHEWTFNTSNEGWTTVGATATVSGGALNITTSGQDPQMISPDNLGLPSSYKYIKVAMKNSTSYATARVFFTTTADTSWTQAKSKSFTVAANNSYYAINTVDMSTVSGWTGTIKRLRIDPLDPAGGAGEVVNIDDIAMFSNVTNAYEWDFDTDGQLEGWTTGDITATVAGGTLNVTATSTDPRLFSPDYLGITSPATYKYVHVELNNYSATTSTQATSQGRIFFITDTDTAWTQAKSKSFAIKTDTGYYGSYIVDMSTVSGWTGTIRRIRVDPLDPALTGQVAKIDYIHITDNQSFRGVMSPQSGVSAGDMDTLKSWGANLMRWQIIEPNYSGAVSSYDSFLNIEMTQLDNAFDLCESRGIKILIDMHLTPGGTDSQQTVIFYDAAANAKFISAWQTLATRYKGRSGLYGYDLVNEPVQTKTPATNCDYPTTIKNVGNAIRAIDRKTPIFVETRDGADPHSFLHATPFGFTNIIYEFHMYEPHAYTQQNVQGSPWTVAYTYPGTIGSSYYDKSKLTDIADTVLTFQTNYSARIYVGEFSAARWASGASTYLRDCIDIFEGYGWSWTYHAYRESSDWSLEYSDVKTSGRQVTPPTDRWNEVVGYGMTLNH